MRHILHVNTDDFYATLARQRDVSLRDRPVIVGNLMNRGNVVSASYEAREAGVHPGLTMQQAARRAPGARLVQIDWAYAKMASRELMGVLQGYAPMVEPAALDEAFVDYTGSSRLFGEPLDAGRRLRTEVRQRVGLDVSIGVASNKLVSRFASSSAKRRRLLDVLPGYEASFLAPQPIERLAIVGAPLAKSLGEMGIETVGDLAKFPTEILEVIYDKLGRQLSESARGIDHTPVLRGKSTPQIHEDLVFSPDLLRWDDLEAQLDRLCSRFGMALRARAWAVKRFALQLEHSDHVRARRQANLPEVSNLDPHLYAAAHKALVAALRRRVRVRRLAVAATHFVPAPVQLNLFETEPHEKLRRLMRATDRIQERYGSGRALGRGRIWNAARS